MRICDSVRTTTRGSRRRISSFPTMTASFAHAALRCVGVGKCRRENGEGEQDTMCPSYMVTREEKHTTRGRAHLLVGDAAR